MSSSSPSSGARAGSSSTGRHRPTSCGDSTCADTRSRGACCRPWAWTARASACSRARSPQGCEPATSCRLARQPRAVRTASSSTPANHAASASTGQATGADPTGMAASACPCAAAWAAGGRSRTMAAPAGTAGAGSQGSCSGAQARPSSACTATSHHNQHWVAAGIRGQAWARAHTSAASSSVCALLASRRSHSTCDMVSMLNRPCAATAAVRPGLPVRPAPHR